MKAQLKEPTATASSSFTRSRLNSRSFKSVATLALSVALFSGCGGLQTRSDIERANETARETPSRPSVPATPSPNPVNPVVVPGPGTPPSVPEQKAPTFLSRELPKVGLILGPGGMKTYAEIGVLRELAKARVPIHAVAGLEWGAVIGGLFASQGQANDAEWKSFKLRDSDLPRTGFLSSQAKPQSIATLGEFLDTAFASSTIEKSKIEFACPAYWSKQDRFGWMTKGLYREAMRACLPYPPLYTDNGGVVASPFAVAEAVSWLKSRGANLIVLVDVLSQGEANPAKGSGDTYEQAAESLLWSEIRREMARARPLVNHVILVNTTGHSIADYASRRALMEAGAKAADETVNKMVTQYGF